MKLILVCFYSCFLTGSFCQKITFSDQKDELDLSSEMMQLVTHLEYFLETTSNKPIYIFKVEDGTIYIDSDKYTKEEKDLINTEIDRWVSFTNITNDKRGGDLAYDFGTDTDWDDLHPTQNLQEVTNNIGNTIIFETMPSQQNCENLEALQLGDLSLLPENYSGTVKCCRNGLISHIWDFKNGKLNGKEIVFNVRSLRVQDFILDDSTIVEKSYLDGILNGQQKKWLSSRNGVTNGIVDRIRIQLYEYNYIDNMLEGLQWECYENGQLKLKKNYTANQLNGLQQEWFYNGQLNHEKYYKEGKLDSLYRKWYENGQLDYEEYYINGKLSGIQRQWNVDGQIIFEKNFKDGKLNGLYREWYTNGRLHTERNYKENNLDGLYFRWNSDGQLLEHFNYKDGIKEGIQKEWFNNGILAKEYFMANGNVANGKCWDSDGNLIKCSW
jgi:antitoxin component YwqK of YwqJK toxin-antitoxin module